MNKVSKTILMLLIVVLAISSYFFIKELVKNKKETDIFDDLQEIVEKDLNIVPNWIEGIQMYKEMKREAEQQRFAQQPQVA